MRQRALGAINCAPPNVIVIDAGQNKSDERLNAILRERAALRDPMPRPSQRAGCPASL